jgi:hypothetical protein
LIRKKIFQDKNCKTKPSKKKEKGTVDVGIAVVIVIGVVSLIVDVGIAVVEDVTIVTFNMYKCLLKAIQI